jgi:hypothetical protein
MIAVGYTALLSESWAIIPYLYITVYYIFVILITAVKGSGLVPSLIISNQLLSRKTIILVSILGMFHTLTFEIMYLLPFKVAIILVLGIMLCVPLIVNLACFFKILEDNRPQISYSRRNDIIRYNALPIYPNNDLLIQNNYLLINDYVIVSLV